MATILWCAHLDEVGGWVGEMRRGNMWVGGWVGGWMSTCSNDSFARRRVGWVGGWVGG